jgi:hypothetical protein
VSVQLHALAALPPGKEPLVPTEQWTEWSPEPVCILWRKEKSLAMASGPKITDWQIITQLMNDKLNSMWKEVVVA